MFETEKSEPGIMKRPPRPETEPLFNAVTLTRALLQGIGVSLALMGIYFWGLQHFSDVNAVRAITYTALIIANLSLIVANQSWHKSLSYRIRYPNTVLILITLAVLFLLAAVFTLPGLTAMFDFTPLPLPLLLTVGAIGAVSAHLFGWMNRFSPHAILTRSRSSAIIGDQHGQKNHR